MGHLRKAALLSSSLHHWSWWLPADYHRRVTAQCIVPTPASYYLPSLPRPWYLLREKKKKKLYSLFFDFRKSYGESPQNGRGGMEWIADQTEDLSPLKSRPSSPKSTPTTDSCKPGSHRHRRQTRGGELGWQIWQDSISPLAVAPCH